MSFIPSKRKVQRVYNCLTDFLLTVGDLNNNYYTAGVLRIHRFSTLNLTQFFNNQTVIIHNKYINKVYVKLDCASIDVMVIVYLSKFMSFLY
jgi:hypothetical protein